MAQTSATSLYTSDLTAQELHGFQAISDFVQNLNDYFSKRNVPAIQAMNLYYRLIEKTGFGNRLIRKHTQLFSNFCRENRRQIIGKSVKLANPIITFSPKIYLDIGYFLQADPEVSEILFQHLLNISAILDPEGGAKEAHPTLFDSSSAAVVPVEREEIPNPLEALGNLGSLGGLEGLMASLGGGGGGAGLGALGGMDLNALLGQSGLDMSQVFGMMRTVIDQLQTQVETQASGGNLDVQSMVETALKVTQNLDLSGLEKKDA